MRLPRPRVYVVVLNWNRLALTRRCIHSLERSGYRNGRIVVVDNGSRDGSGEALQSEFRQHCIILNNHNDGFARGCNIGIRHALQDSECAYVLLLNNDATLEVGALDAAVAFAEAAPEVGLVGGKILHSPTSRLIWYAGGDISLLRGQAFPRGSWETDVGQYEEICDVGFVTGGLMLIRRRVLEEVGLLPEEYFFGVEEWDYSVAVKRAGYRLCYTPYFKAFHSGDGSHWNYDPKFVYNYYRNKLIFQQKYLPPWLFPFWRLMFVFYARFFARARRQVLIDRYDSDKTIPVDDLDFALAEALKDHGTGSLTEETIQRFALRLQARNVGKVKTE